MNAPKKTLDKMFDVTLSTAGLKANMEYARALEVKFWRASMPFTQAQSGIIEALGKRK